MKENIESAICEIEIVETMLNILSNELDLDMATPDESASYNFTHRHGDMSCYYIVIKDYLQRAKSRLAKY